MKRLIKDLLIRLTDKFAPLDGVINQSGGFVINKISNKSISLEKLVELRNELLGSKKIMNEVMNLDFGTMLRFHDCLLKVPGISKIIDVNLISEIKEYLGKSVKLDRVELNIFNTIKGNKNKNNSGNWHHDSVGHRIKVYIPLNELGSLEYPTCYIKGSHNFKWPTFENVNSSDGSRVSEYNLNTSNPKNIINKTSKFGEFYAFDTNGAHKGDYKKSKTPRIMIIFEFSNKKDLMMFGQVGPSHFLLHQDDLDHLKKFNLIRTKRIKTIKNSIYCHIGTKRNGPQKSILDYIG